MNQSLKFFVPGIPAPGGSKKAFIRNGRVNMVDAGKNNKPWRASVALFASQAIQKLEVFTLMDGPLSLELMFAMPRTGSHYGTGRNKGVLKANAPEHHIVTPDATKLTRALEDALTGIVWTDDARIARQFITKVYADKPGAYVCVSEIVSAGRGAE
jgi:Holliday junction resolvase RusA-like endonuclease